MSEPCSAHAWRVVTVVDRGRLGLGGELHYACMLCGATQVAAVHTLNGIVIPYEAEWRT